MNRAPVRTPLSLLRLVHVLLVNKFLDYLASAHLPSLPFSRRLPQILAFYFLFVKMIKHISANYRRRRLPGAHREMACDLDLLALEASFAAHRRGARL